VYSGLIDKVSRSVKAVGHGDYYRAAESVMPVSIERAMSAYRELTEGVSSISGKPMYNIGSSQRFHLSGWDAILQSMAFQPAEKSRVSDTRQSMLLAKKKFDDRKEQIYTGLTSGKQSISDVMPDVLRFNKEVREDGLLGVVPLIKAEELRKHLKHKLDKNWIRFTTDLRETY
jgi:hypothetical protein